MRGHLGGAGLVCQETRWVDEISAELTMDYLLSGRGVSLLYERLAGMRLAAADVARRFHQDEMARKVFGIIGHHFGHYLVTLGRMLNPRAFILAGSVTNSSELFLSNAVEIAERNLEPACRPELITVSRLETPACQGLA